MGPGREFGNPGSPGFVGGIAISDDDSILGDDADDHSLGLAIFEPDSIGNKSWPEDDDSGSDKVASGPNFASPVSSSKVGGTVIHAQDSILGDSIDEENDSGSDEVVSEPYLDQFCRPGDHDIHTSFDGDDTDMLAGPDDILGNLDIGNQFDYEEDDDDFGGEGLGGRLLTAMLLGNLVTDPTAGPSSIPARSHPYTADDFEDVPDTFFA